MKWLTLHRTDGSISTRLVIHAMINPQIYLVWYNPFLFMFNMGCITKEIKKHYWIKKEKEKTI